MNFLITSIASLNFNNIHDEYFRAINISSYHSGSVVVHTVNDRIKQDLSYSIFGSNIPSTMEQLDNYIVCFCSEKSAVETLMNIYSFNYSNAYNNSSYDEYEHDFGHWLFHEYDYVPTSSCVLTDTEKMLTWIFSDVAASVPVWYSFNDVSRKSHQDFIVSSDLLLASRLGFALNSFVSVGGGQVVSIDINTETVHFVGHFQADRPSRYKHSSANSESHIDLYSQLLLSSAMESVLTALEAVNNSVVFTELDALDSSSQLLQCTINSLTVAADDKDMQIIHAASVKAEISVFDRISTSNVVSSLIDSILENEDHRPAPFNLIRRLADERWRLCQAAADHFRTVTHSNPTATNPALFLSFDDGLMKATKRQVKVYLQNLLCPLLNVKVVYPFARTAYQNSLWRTDIPHSFLYQSMGVLHRSNLCQEVESTRIQSSSPPSGLRSQCNSKNDSHECQQQPMLYDSLAVQQFSHLWHAVRQHATDSGHIVLLLVTSGYLDLLSNFICSVRSFQPTFHAFLIITVDDVVVRYAQSLGVGFYRMTNHSQPFSYNYADFGTMKYQRLILGRTEIAMKLLLMGYKPVIADIDAVWLSDPLRFLNQPQSADEGDYDVAITDDNGEVCGCFVALSNSEPAKLFWAEVLRQHRELVERGELTKFSDSEQKILTALIFGKKYRNEALFRLLPKSQFPSGFMYFNLHSGRTGPSPAVIHNNFLIGKEMKKERFKRYGLWFTAETEGSYSAPGRCVVDTLLAWRKGFGNASRDVYIPSLNVVLPVHNSMAVTDRVMVQVLREEPISEAVRREEDLVIWVESDPPKYAQFSSTAIAELSLGITKVVASITASIYNTNIEISVDVGANRDTFAADFGGNTAILKLAHEKVQNISLRHPLQAPELAYTKDAAIAEERTVRLRYCIKVLAFKRADSLDRLLKSLLAANYRGYSDISLEIFVDYAKHIQDAYSVNATTHVAEAFVWPYGSKRVTRRMKNYGLASQWFFAWIPEDENEVAFIFEDDVEVSPFFFTWASQVAEKYYESSMSTQKEIHRDLLQAVRGHIKVDGSKRIVNDSIDSWSTLEAFAAKYAGDPILFGACLQKQNLDPSHYPKKLELHTGYRPFLYSLVGSWGPMMFPLFWQAFQEWWTWSARRAVDKGTLEPQTENIVINHFYRENMKIWTPWIVRFAYETGCKCLYANLPGDLSLVVNHREEGENYKSAQGMHAKLLSTDVLKAAELESNGRLTYDATGREHFLTALRWSLLYLPEYSVLSKWQFDLHLRRLGSHGMLAPYYSASLPAEVVEVVNNVVQCAHDTHVLLSLEHWLAVSEMLESHMLPDSIIMHVTVTPLLPLLGKIFWRHTVLISDNSHQCACIENRLRMPADSLSDQQIHCVTALPSNSYVDLAVLQLPDLAEASDMQIMHAISSLSLPPRYLLVVGPCSSAPTDLTISLSRMDAASVSDTTVQYVQMEAICHLGGSVGAVLFETSSAFYGRSSAENHQGRFSISRQTAQNLSFRSTIVRENRQPFL